MLIHKLLKPACMSYLHEKDRLAVLDNLYYLLYSKNLE